MRSAIAGTKGDSGKCGARDFRFSYCKFLSVPGLPTKPSANCITRRHRRRRRRRGFVPSSSRGLSPLPSASKRPPRARLLRSRRCGVSKLLEKLRSDARGAFLSARRERECRTCKILMPTRKRAAALRCVSLDYRKMPLRHEHAFPFILTKAQREKHH